MFIDDIPQNSINIINATKRRMILEKDFTATIVVILDALGPTSLHQDAKSVKSHSYKIMRRINAHQINVVRDLTQRAKTCKSCIPRCGTEWYMTSFEDNNTVIRMAFRIGYRSTDANDAPTDDSQVICLPSRNIPVRSHAKRYGFAVTDAME
jgi:hypothetical protein